MSASERSERPSLLIVEDSRIQAKMLSHKLIEAGYEVRIAQNGQIGLNLIREQRPTLVISDIEMPVMSGYELCSAVKHDPELRSIPFILLSTLNDAQDIIKGLHCGADNYVTKPYDPSYLVSRVESLLETPIAEDQVEQPLQVSLGGTSYSVKAGRQQVLNLLVSTFENAVEKNKELAQTNEELTIAKEQLDRHNQELTGLNEQLQSANERMRSDLEAAAKVQQSLLPTSKPDTSRVQFAWRYLPCDELGGDFLNFFALDEQHIAVYNVDVSGHGVASSLLSVAIARMLTPQVSSSSLLVQRQIGTNETRVVPPAEVAYELNRRFPMEEQNDMTFTMVYGVLNLETLEFRFVSAGHDPAVHVPRGCSPYKLDCGGLTIGWVADIEYDEYSVQLQPGDRLYLYSDGVPEAMNDAMDQFTFERMLEIIELGQSQPLEDSASLLLTAVKRWCAKHGPKDDVSLLCLEIASED
ncbi:MAG: SpoIIE family protein phosphatase [Aureliella sp.]